ncbi:MAG: DNA repair protein RecO [Elusimicrobia bacterium RIFCSPLOWO2_01_FULL_54_10]|nr:MAG: DNA repair protein RecO [Elusimicrobia bacterium RIFCSPLOWO2_01_FULL_54_10]
MIQSVQAIILRAADAGDFAQKLTVYSRELGKFKANVAGVKKMASKLRSLAQPFAESRLQIYLHGTVRAGVNDPGKLIGGEPLAVRPRLRSTLDRMVQAQVFCETLDTLTKTFYPNEAEYDLLAGTLQSLEETEFPLLVRLRSTLILLKILGYGLRHHPVWKAMPASDRNLLLRLGSWPAEEAVFSSDEAETLSHITQSYLALFLPMPLKSEMFMRKVAAA